MDYDENFPQIGETINQYSIETLLTITSKSTRIYTAYSNLLKTQVILKVISLKDADIHLVDSETQILTETNSLYVLNAIDVFNFNYKKNSNSKANLLRFLVTPKVGDQDAYNFPQKAEYAKYIIYDALKGLQYLHGMNIIHRDIKPENILIQYINDKKNKNTQSSTDDLFNFDINLSTNYLLNNENIDSRPIRAVLCDFGLSKQYPAYQEMIETEEFVGTLQYCSPQVAVHAPYNESTDIWSLGATAYFLLYDEFPFDHSETDSMVDIKSIFSCNYSFPPKRDIPIEAKDLISKMLQFSEYDRISVEDALNHIWFKDIIESSRNDDE